MAIEKRQIERVVRRIVEDFDPKLVLIFGSVAKGTDDGDSDLDLMVVMDSDQSFVMRTADVRFSIGIVDFSIDLLVYTPEEFEERRGNKYSVVYEALQTGVVAYGIA
ncbi:MAG: nucleotidyltransferase domain-containing protein [Candidatus Methanoplasma sp.]|jgi:predicted nucleotidyltransferase|nr:nucleotidyltransferase domain-containing protein [Candidatus Methanoplasma sp.]